MTPRRLALAVACLLPGLAAAHEKRPDERAIVQFRVDATEVLYEVRIPVALQAAKWRLVGDTDRNGVLSDRELATLAQTMAKEAARLMTLELDGNRLPFEVRDAKLQDVPTVDRLTGRLALIALLGTRPLPPGVRKVSLVGRPFVRGGSPVVFRIETDEAFAKVTSLVGGGAVPLEDGAPAVKLRAGERATLLVDVAAK